MRRFIVPLLAVLLPLIAIFSLAQPGSGPSNQAEVMKALKDEVPGIRFYMTGQRVTSVYGKKFGFGETPEATANAFLTRYGSIFSPGDGQYQFEGIQDVMNGKFTAVYFREMLGAVPVDRAWLTVLVKNESGYPAVLASTNVQNVDMIPTTPRVSSDDAQSLVKRLAPGMKYFSKPKLWVYKGETDTRLTWAFMADNLVLENRKSFQVFVDAETPQVLEWRNKVYNTDVTGSTKGFATPGLKPDETINPPVQMILAGLRVAITGGNSAYSDTLGNFIIPNAGDSQVTVTADMTGRWVRVIPSQGTKLQDSKNVVPPGPADFNFNTAPTEFNTAQVNGFIQTEIVHNFAKSVNNNYPGIDYQIPTTVNIASTCNAYYTGRTINFYQAVAGGNGCPNMAYSTVVYHEYGHFIIESGHPSPTGDYHEGMADTNSDMLSNNPWVGEDFSGPNTGPLRSAYNNFNYPCNGGAHDCGNVISGAFWLTLDAMKAKVGEQAALQFVRSWYLNSILLRPPGITPQITIDVLTLDDDDGDLGNGTPHYAQIEQGFGAKNLHAPPLDWLKYTPISMPGDFFQVGPNGTVIPFKFKVENGAGTLNPGSFKINYKYDTGSWVSLSIPGTGGVYSWGMPAKSGTTLSWYLSANDTNGNTQYYPKAGQSAAFTTVIGRGTTPVFTDTFESDMGWTVVNESLSTGAWVRGDPNGTTLDGRQANPENDSGDSGAQCMFTGQGAVGGAVGDNDVDGGPTRLVSPTFNMSSGTHIVEIYRWFYNSTGEDVMTIDVSNDNGATWVPVQTITDTGSSNQWLLTKFSVSAYVTPTATVKFRLSTADQPNNSIVEGAIDNVIVKKVLK